MHVQGAAPHLLNSNGQYNILFTVSQMKFNAKKVESLRKSKKLSQAKLASAAGVHRRTITGITKAAKNGVLIESIRLDTINKIAAALGVKPESLLG